VNTSIFRTDIPFSPFREMKTTINKLNGKKYSQQFNSAGVLEPRKGYAILFLKDLNSLSIEPKKGNVGSKTIPQVRRKN
jgi:hypothetical protein